MADENKEDKTFNYVNDLFSNTRHLTSIREEYTESSWYTLPTSHYGNIQSIQEKDVIGIVLDLSNNSSKIEYYLNGVSQGIAFEEIEYEKCLFPAVALAKKEQIVTLIFEEDKLIYKSKIPKGYECLNIDGLNDKNKHVAALWNYEQSCINIEKDHQGMKIFGKRWTQTTAVLKAAKLETGKKYYFECALKSNDKNGSSIFFGFVDSSFELTGCVGEDDHSWAVTTKMQKHGIDGVKRYTKIKTSELKNNFDKTERDIVIDHLKEAGFEECSFGFELKNYEKLVEYHDKLQRKRVEESVQVKKSISQKGGYPVLSKRLEATARVLLCGVYDDNHSLSVFGGMRYIIKAIWEYANDFNDHIWSKHIKFNEEESYNESKKIYCASMGRYPFPKPTGTVYKERKN